MVEFTGERVVPGEVDNDLWNEHLSRYLFASRLCRHKRVIDIGCGTGYGSAQIAKSAATVTGLDLSVDALHFADIHYVQPNLSYIAGSGTALPFQDSSFDLVIAFELIEHLDNWTALLEQAQRVLTPSGQFVVSTPNRLFYEESRRAAGPNPFHVHEFDFEEFGDQLRKYFPHVSLFVQNHGPSIVFQPVEPPTGAQVTVEAADLKPEECNFFVAVCARTRQIGSPTYVHVPTVANVLRERSQHIVKLEEELRTKDDWLNAAKAEHAELLEKFGALEIELEERNHWAEKLDAELDEARHRIDRLHVEKDAEIAQIASGYEEKVTALERELETQSRWAMKTQEDLDKCAKLLDAAENTVKERTIWAQRLDAEVEALRAKVSIMEASRWIKLGRAIGVGPRVEQK